jgi:hypothetical protein
MTSWQFHFRLCITAMAISSASTLASARNDWGIVILLAAGCITSLIFTDWLKWISIPRILGNILAIGVVSVGLRGFIGAYLSDQQQADNQLHLIGRLLVVLQLIVLHQAKSTRLYWQLLVLTLLSVVVGAAIRPDTRFAYFFAIYVVVAFFAAGYFFAFQQLERFAGQEVDRGRFQLPWRWGQPAAIESSESSSSQSHLAGKLDRFRLVADYARSHLAQRSTVVLAASLAIAWVFYVFSPRVSAENSGRRAGRQASVGFSPFVSLDRLGALLQSHEPVAKVAISVPGGQTVDFNGREFYFQGVTLHSYNIDSKLWQAVEVKQQPQQSIRSSLYPPPEGVTTFVQEIVMEPASDSTLFSIRPVYRDEHTPDGIKNSIDDGKLFRIGVAMRDTNRDFRYSVRVAGLAGNNQMSLAAPELYDDSPVTLARMKLQIEEAREFSENRFPRLKAEADRLLRQSGAVNPNAFQIATYYRNFLSGPGEFKYSLNANQPRDPKLDPIEDFLVNHKTGHCQYFASALAMMLRSQGIPSRICVGYHGGQYNPIGRFYQLRQSDCHAWVEAFVPPEAIPPSEIEFLEDEEKTEADVLAMFPHGAWLRLDPTPTDEAQSRRDYSGLFSWYYDFVQYMEVLWSDFVLDLNSAQRTTSEEPAQGRVADTRPSTSTGSNTTWWQINWRRWRLVQMIRDLQSDRRTTSILGALSLTVLVVGMGTAIYRRRISARQQLQLDAQTPPFFRRLQRLAAKYQIARRPGETPREFSRRLAAVIEPTHPQAARYVIELCEMLYQIRFGGRPFAAEESEPTERKVDVIGAALANHRNRSQQAPTTLQVGG